MIQTPSRQLYEVEITFRIFVTAFNRKNAESWAEDNVTEWSSDPPEITHSREVTEAYGNTLPAEVQLALPWAADGLSDDENNKPTRWWFTKPI